MKKALLSLLLFLNPWRKVGRFQSFLKILLFWNPVFNLAFNIFLNNYDRFLGNWAASWTISNVVCAVCFFGIHAIYRIEALLFGALKKPAPKHGRPWSFALSLMFMVPGLYLGFAAVARLSPYLGIDWRVPDLEMYRNGIFFGTLIATGFTVWESYRLVRQSERAALLQVKQLENERLKAQLSALTAQMNPHFLFNALNTVLSLIPSDPKAAEETVLRISELYRGILESSKTSTHPLSIELEICRAYLKIEKTRFGERLNSEITVSPELSPAEIVVPSLCIQPLVENAIKHGFAKRSLPGHLLIQVKKENENLLIHVQDDGLGMNAKSQMPGTGTGISSCRERLKIMYGDTARLNFAERIGGGTLVSITLPLNLPKATGIA